MKQVNRTILIVTLLLPVFSCIYGFGQVPKNETSDSWINEIKGELDRINKDTGKLRIVQKKVLGHSTEGGYFRAYYDDKTLRKAILAFYGENGQSKSEYYLLNGEIISVKQTGIEYESPIYMGKTEIKSEEVERFYFKNKKLVQWVKQDGYIMPAAEYPEKEKELLDDFKIIE